jgi:hypothetical protein
MFHVVALTEDGLVYAWSESHDRALLGNVYCPLAERDLLPKPVGALSNVRVCAVVVANGRSWHWLATAGCGRGTLTGLRSDVMAKDGIGRMARR